MEGRRRVEASQRLKNTLNHQRKRRERLTSLERRTEQYFFRSQNP